MSLPPPPARDPDYCEPVVFTDGPPRNHAIHDDIDLTLLVACYNESENIVNTLDTLVSALIEFPDVSWEVLVVDDASNDASVDVIRDWLSRHPGMPIYLRANRTNKGLATNYVDGAFWGRGRHYRLVCGDDVEPKENFVTMLRHLGAADIVIFYQTQSGRAWHRRVLSRTYTALVNLISGYRLKYYNGLAIHRRYNIMRLNTAHTGHGFQADFITRLLDRGASYVTVDVTARERPRGVATAMTLRNFLSVSHTIIDLIARRIDRLISPSR